MSTNERFARVLPQDLDEDARRVRDEILSGPRGTVPGQFPLVADDGSLVGPFGVFLFSPAIGGPLQQLGAALRAGSQLSMRERELATLAIAARLDSAFELRAHAPLARSAGITDDEMRAVLAGDALPDPKEQALLEFARANASEVAPHAEFDRLCEHYNRQQTFEITALVAYYRGLASMLELNRIAMPHLPQDPVLDGEGPA